MRSLVCLQVFGQVVGSRPRPGGSCGLDRGQALAGRLRARLRLTCSFTAFTDLHSTCQFIDWKMIHFLWPASMLVKSSQIIWVFSFFMEEEDFCCGCCCFFKSNISFFSVTFPTGLLPHFPGVLLMMCYSLQLTNNLQLYSVVCRISAAPSNILFFAVTFCDFAICGRGSWRATQCAVCLWPSKPRALLQFGKWPQKCCKGKKKQNFEWCCGASCITVRTWRTVLFFLSLFNSYRSQQEGSINSGAVCGVFIS